MSKKKIEHTMPGTMFLHWNNDSDDPCDCVGTDTRTGLFSECGASSDFPIVVGVYELVRVERVQSTEGVRVVERSEP